jgi:pentatricopeptide repeat protein
VFVRGEPQVYCEGELLNLTEGGRKHLELLALLVAAPEGQVHRDVMERALWAHLQDRGETSNGRKPNRASALFTKLRDALRQALPDLPEVQAARLVWLDRTNVGRLNAELIRSDAAAFRAACARMRHPADCADSLEAWQVARTMYGGDLLTNSGYPWISDADRGFLVDLQDWYRTIWADALLALAGRIERAERDYATASAIYEDAFTAECRRDGPIREDATRGLLRCYAALGRFAAAVRAYRAMREEHCRKFGEEGDDPADPAFDGAPETEDLHKAILARAEQQTPESNS